MKEGRVIRMRDGAIVTFHIPLLGHRAGMDREHICDCLASLLPTMLTFLGISGRASTKIDQVSHRCEGNCCQCGKRGKLPPPERPMGGHKGERPRSTMTSKDKQLPLQRKKQRLLPSFPSGLVTRFSQEGRGSFVGLYNQETILWTHLQLGLGRLDSS